MTLKEKLDIYFKSNPIDDNAENKYGDVRKKFKISLKLASNYWNRYKKANNSYYSQPIKLGERVKSFSNQTLNISTNIDFEVRNIDDLLAVCDVDPNEYEVITWESLKKDIRVGTEIKQLYSIKARFKPVKIDNNIELQKEFLLKELYQKSPKSNISYGKKNTDSNKYLLELALFDVHFGKLSHREEVGEDYDIYIATERWHNAVNSLLSRVNLKDIEKILLPVGNDLINIDNFRNQTTAGTPQDVDSRFHKIVRTVRDVLITTINKLKEIAPVDVVCVSGNHDQQTAFLLVDIIDAYYHNDNNVSVFNQPTLRKYYQYGNTSIMFTHGDKERFNDLGMIFAAENPKLWANTKQRYIQIGHLHHNKKQTFVVQEYQGFTIQIIPSLSTNDAWHAGKGFNSLKQAKAFLYNKKEGLVGEFSYTV